MCPLYLLCTNQCPCPNLLMQVQTHEKLPARACLHIGARPPLARPDRMGRGQVAASVCIFAGQEKWTCSQQMVLRKDPNSSGATCELASTIHRLLCRGWPKSKSSGRSVCSCPPVIHNIKLCKTPSLPLKTSRTANLKEARRLL